VINHKWTELIVCKNGLNKSPEDQSMIYRNEVYARGTETSGEGTAIGGEKNRVLSSV